MWRRIELRNFRSIEKLEVELTPFSLLVGPNGSGKSNFADVFPFVRDLGIDALSAISSRGGIQGVRRWSRTKPFDVQVDVRVARSREDLDSNYQRHRVVIGSGSEGEWSFKEELVEISKDAEPVYALLRRADKIIKASGAGVRWIKDGGEIPRTTSIMIPARQFIPGRFKALSNVRKLRLNPDEMRKPQIPTEDSRLEESGANLATAIHSMRSRDTKRFDGVMDAMKRIVPGLLDIGVASVGRYQTLQFVQAQSGGEAQFQATEMSEGSIRTLGILVACKQMKREEMLIVEEPEVNVHPAAAALLFEELREASKAGNVMVTTHSPELLDAASDETILVCEYRDGATNIGPIAKPQRDLVREGLFKLSEILRSEPLRIEGTSPAVDPAS